MIAKLNEEVDSKKVNSASVAACFLTGFTCCHSFSVSVKTFLAGSVQTSHRRNASRASTLISTPRLVMFGAGSKREPSCMRFNLVLIDLRAVETSRSLDWPLLETSIPLR